MAEPVAIATLIPIDKRRWTRDAFLSPHNREFYRPPIDRFRDCIGAPYDPSRNSQQPIDFHRLQLDTGNFPPGGLLFGSDPARCHILLGEHAKGRGISDVHFCLTYNKNGDLVLRDHSFWGTTVSYNGQARTERRRHFTWIIKTKGDNADISGVEIGVPRQGDFQFRIEQSEHDNCEVLEQLRKVVSKESDDALLSYSAFEKGSHQTAKRANKIPGLDQSPIYIICKKLGEGTSGIVDLVFDASTAIRYAKKRFKPPKDEEDQKKSTWLRKVEQEIRIMKNNSHVSVIDCRYARRILIWLAATYRSSYRLPH